MREFDYIIVGGGSAGCVLAERLTACGRYTSSCWLQLVDRRFSVKVPIGYGILFHQRAVNWMYSSDPEPNSVAVKSIIRVASFLAGRVQSTLWSIIAGMRAIMTIGPMPAMTAGTMLGSHPPDRIETEMRSGRPGLTISDTVRTINARRHLRDICAQGSLAMEVPPREGLGVGPYLTTTRRGLRCSVPLPSAAGPTPPISPL